MLDIDTSSKSEQRKFGLLIAVALALLVFVRWLIHGWLHGFAGLSTFSIAMLVVAAIFLVLGLLLPRALRPVFVLWMKFAEAVNWVMTRVLLTVAFYGMISPVRVLVQIFSEDPLKRKRLPDAPTYWEEPEDQPKEFDRYRQQF